MSQITAAKEKLRVYSKTHPWLEKIWLKTWWLVTGVRFLRFSDYEYARRLCDSFNGKSPNINEPKTFNEKMWFLKLSNRDPLLTKCSDKHQVREYISSCGFSDILKTEYACYEKASDIDFDFLPSPCYIKCNHASGMNFIYYREKEQNIKHIKWKFDFLLKQNPYRLSREWNYKNIPPRIVCEEVLEMPDGSDIPELQFFCFRGTPRFIMYNLGLADNTGNHKRATRWVLDMNWNIIDVVTSMPTSSDIPHKPLNYDYMVEIAKKLSAPFPHVRVDLFNINGKVFFNELTFYSGGGNVFLKPYEWQHTIGEWIDCSEYRIAEDAVRKHYFKR